MNKAAAKHATKVLIFILLAVISVAAYGLAIMYLVQLLPFYVSMILLGVLVFGGVCTMIWRAEYDYHKRRHG